MAKSERAIQTAIMDMLLMHPRIGWAYVTTTGTFRGLKGGRPIKIGYPGMSDIIGQMRDGRFFAIEVKQPGETPSSDQLEFINIVQSFDGVAGWATSIEEAKAIIK